MKTSQPAPDLRIADRIRRSQGRLARNTMAAAKVTRDEREELNLAARSEGKAFSEWAREVLLEKARHGRTELAVITELTALRMLLSTVLRPVALGETVTAEAYSQILAEVRTGKHDAARHVLDQYRNPTKEQ